MSNGMYWVIVKFHSQLWLLEVSRSLGHYLLGRIYYCRN